MSLEERYNKIKNLKICLINFELDIREVCQQHALLSGVLEVAHIEDKYKQIKTFFFNPLLKKIVISVSIFTFIVFFTLISAHSYLNMICAVVAWMMMMYSLILTVEFKMASEKFVNVIKQRIT